MVRGRILPVGERALLVEVDGLAEVLRTHAALDAARIEGVVDLVPAARTVLVRIDSRVLQPTAARAWIAGVEIPEAGAVAAGSPVELDVVYDGADLADTAELLGLTTDGLVARHSAACWTVAFTGFAPGFGYLVSDDWPFDVPRLDVPRTRVPAGSVALAAGFSGAYPRETPGGWRLIGATDAPLFDPDSDSPALLMPGTRVRFRVAPAARAAGAGAAVSSAGAAAAGAGAPVSSAGAPTAGPALRILEPGLLATIQDLGRPGAASLGVSASGALDRGALRTANRLVGNREDAAGIEVTMGGLRAVADTDLWFAVTGGWGPVRVDGREVDPYAAQAWPAGAELHLDWLSHGARAYLAVRGGVEARLALGSRSTDLLAGLGPAPLRAGAVVAVGDAASVPVPATTIAPWSAPDDAELLVELGPGARADWFTAAARAQLYDAVWTVTNDADRVGMRLDGPVLERSRDGELPSEGMVPGALQVPPSGRPTILLADGPVTGGYPVIAVATDASLDLLAQARPGTRIRFRHARPTR
ncbi:KipI family sensor histidine kinase inhibitor [Microbacterium terrae]|uniref:KipI antagonist n=1 Tax=Microbacterium terrae TaxID=69369 RepID=A0A0M2GZ55_9MICO|nr:5-oxoprolinase/urea amidolyase family protein [Microbacterium terrae]KJL39382.1 KipI antagonist [Microbacterium terrae]MBP1078330.1 KipI family sensor histidine kinase inhibitor [Microbacterium terrae]GLJ97809.1 allophanate hydrolase [Microbacterium terrae]